MSEPLIPRQHPTADDGPTQLRGLPGRLWWRAFKRIRTRFTDDHLTVWAAALTYYGVLSLFPALLVFVSVLRLTGERNTATVLQKLTDTTPGPARDILRTALTDLEKGHQSTAGVLASVGLLVALWSASSYVGAFMQAANAIYDVPEGRPFWKKLPIRLGITVGAGIAVTVAALAVVFTGGLARRAASLIDVTNSAVQVWDVVKWPALLVLIGLLFAMLYWAAPNARQSGFRWVTAGSALAVLIWVIASAGFAIYVANFGSYNKTYGSLAAVIIFLIWMWISNLAILIGAEFDAELQRERAIDAGLPDDSEPYMRLRDTREHRGSDL